MPRIPTRQFFRAFQSKIHPVLSHQGRLKKGLSKSDPLVLELVKKEHTYPELRALILDKIPDKLHTRMKDFRNKWSNELSQLQGGKGWEGLKKEPLSELQKAHWEAFRNDLIENFMQGCLDDYYGDLNRHPPDMFFVGTPSFTSDKDVTLSDHPAGSGSHSEAELMTCKLMLEVLTQELTSSRGGFALDLEFYVRHNGLLYTESKLQTKGGKAAFNRIERKAAFLQTFKAIAKETAQPDHPRWELFKERTLAAVPEKAQELGEDFADVEQFYFQHQKEAFRWLYKQHCLRNSISYQEDLSIEEIRNILPKEEMEQEFDLQCFRKEKNMRLSIKLDEVSEKLRNKEKQLKKESSWFFHTAKKKRCIEKIKQEMDALYNEYVSLSDCRVIDFDEGCFTESFLHFVVMNEGGQKSERMREGILKQVRAGDVVELSREKLKENSDTDCVGTYWENFGWGFSKLGESPDIKEILAAAKYFERAFLAAIMEMEKVRNADKASWSQEDEDLFISMQKIYKKEFNLLRIKRNQFLHPKHVVKFFSKLFSEDQKKMQTIRSAMQISPKKLKKVDDNGLKLFRDRLERALQEVNFLENNKEAFNHLIKKIEPIFQNATSPISAWKRAQAYIKAEFPYLDATKTTRLLKSLQPDPTKATGMGEIHPEDAYKALALKFAFNPSTGKLWNSKMEALLKQIMGIKSDNPMQRLVRQESEELTIQGLGLTTQKGYEQWQEELFNVHARFLVWLDGKKKFETEGASVPSLAKEYTSVGEKPRKLKRGTRITKSLEKLFPKGSSPKMQGKGE